MLPHNFPPWKTVYYYCRLGRKDGSWEVSNRAALKAAQAFVEQPWGWLMLVGSNGCGKTYLAAAIANRCIERGESALFVAVTDLLNHLRVAFAPRRWGLTRCSSR